MDAQLWWILPNPRLFLDAIEHAIKNERCLIIEWPEFGPDGLVRCIENRLAELGGFSLYKTSWCERRPDDTPTSFLNREMLHPRSRITMPSAETIVNAEELQESVIFVEEIDPSSVEAWQLFIKVFATVRSGSRLEIPPTVCLTIPAQTTSLNDPHIKTIQWLGRAQSSDISSYVTMISPSRGRSPIEQELKNSIISQLSGYDPKLASFLSDLELEELLHPEEAIERFASEQRFSRETNIESDGWLVKLDDEDFIHTAYLTLFDDGQRIIKKRVLKGQIIALLPRLEDIRLRIALAFKDLIKLPIDQMYGDEKTQIKDIEDVEFGHMWRQLRRTKVSRNVLNFVNDCRKLRNKLSHGELIGTVDLKRFSADWKSVRTVLPPEETQFILEPLLSQDGNIL